MNSTSLFSGRTRTRRALATAGLVILGAGALTACGSKTSDTAATHARDLFARALVCALVPRVPIIPLITFAFRAGPSKRRRRSWASHSLLGRLPHRPAGYSTSLRTPLALPFGAEKGVMGVVSQQKRAERRRVFSLAVRVAVS